MHPSGLPRRAALGLLTVVLVISSPPPGGALDADVARLRATVAPPVTLRGRVFEERRRPAAPDQPLPGTVVTLLPRSEAFLGRLAGLKATARDSLDAYTRAGTSIRSVRDDYERALRDAGAADLVHARAVDADGTFTFDAVVPGAWILMGWRSSGPDDRSSGRSAGKTSGRFSPSHRPVADQVVTVWLREFSVGAEGSETIELTDRNVWFSGPAERPVPGAGR